MYLYNSKKSYFCKRNIIKKKKRLEEKQKGQYSHPLKNCQQIINEYCNIKILFIFKMLSWQP